VSALVVVAAPAPAQAAPAYPAVHGRCVDQVGVLGGTLCDRVTAVLRTDEKATGDEIAVAVVPTTGDMTIEKWSTGLFNKWGVGKADRGNGVLLVVAVDDHAVRLEIGTGMAGRLPEATVSHIVDGVITPSLAEERYATGILTGLDEVRRDLRHKVATSLVSLASLAPTTAPATSDTSGDSYSDDGYTVDADGDLVGPLGGDLDGGTDAGTPAWPFVLFGLAVVGALLVALSRAGRSGAGRSASGPGPSRPGRSFLDTHHTDHSSRSSDDAPAFLAASTFTPDFSSSSPDTSSSSSSSSSSDFGGGSSSGGGDSGSW
jgi:uncharacterized protein